MPSRCLDLKFVNYSTTSTHSFFVRFHEWLTSGKIASFFSLNYNCSMIECNPTLSIYIDESSSVSVGSLLHMLLHSLYSSYIDPPLALAIFNLEQCQTIRREQHNRRASSNQRIYNYLFGALDVHTRKTTRWSKKQVDIHNS
jgi:hypothetical protein